MYLNLFGLEIPMYGVLFWFGILAAAATAALIREKRGISGFDLAGSAIYTMIGAIIGAKLLYLTVSFVDILEYASVYELSFIEMLPLVIKGGFVFYGGLIGGFLGLFIYTRQFEMELSCLLDIYATVLPLGHAIGRVGCFFGGCCYGIAYDGPFSHTYHTATGTAPIGVALFPVQLLEATCLVILFVFQLYLFIKKRDIKGITVVNYVIVYAVLRFSLEFLRGDAERGLLGTLSTSQWISIAMLLLTVLVLVCTSIRKKLNFKLF